MLKENVMQTFFAGQAFAAEAVLDDDDYDRLCQHSSMSN